jgi:uncharacterized protein
MVITKLAVAAAVALIGVVPSARPVVTDGWAGMVRESVRIPMGGGWVAQGEFTYPRGAKGKAPVLVLLHGSGPNDMNQTVAGGATFTPIAQAANRKGFAVLRFNKRGVTGVGPVLSDDDAQVHPAKPYEQRLDDAAAVVRYAGGLGDRVFLLGHSEGTQIAGNLAARPRAWGIKKPAGVIEMGVVGGTAREVFYYQAIGRELTRLHDEADFDGDGTLRGAEIPAELAGLELDADHDGALSIDGELRPAREQALQIDKFPDVRGVPAGITDYVVDFGRFPTPAEDLPRYDGPVLLLNGETDVQTRVRGARDADAALEKAGNKDHTLVTYPGMSHFMNVAPQYSDVQGSPAEAVVDTVAGWLAGHR